MKILVVGGAGFIGSNLCAALKLGGHEITVVDNLSCSRGIPAYLAENFIHGDIANDSTWQRVLDKGVQFDLIYHLAASFANELSVNYPHVDCLSNIVGTVNVIRYAKKMGSPRIVYAGSSSSYGVSNGVPFTENDTPHPSTPYALSKYVGEQYLYTMYSDYVVLRLFNVYGPYDIPGVFRNVIPNMIASAMNNRVVNVYGSKSTRDFTFVDDVVAVLLEQAKLRSRQVYNVCSGKEVLILNLANQIRSLVGGEISLILSDNRSWDTVVTRVGNPTKLHEALGFSPTKTMEEGLPSTYRYVKGYLNAVS